MIRAGAALLLGVALAVPVGCRGSTMTPPNPDGGDIFCTDTASCGKDLLTPCVMGVCVPRPSTTQVWAAEIVPAPSVEMDGGTVPAPVTEVTGVVIDVDQVMLKTTERDFVTVSFSSPSGANPRSASVQLTVPAAIPGRPALTFQSHLQTATLGATLSVPHSVLDRSMSVSFLPSSDDQTTPPQTFAISTPTRVIGPLALETGVAIRGSLVDGANQPKGGYSARAFQGGVQVSTRGVVDATGKFTLLVPAAVSGADVATTVQLDPASGSSDPWLTNQYDRVPVSISARLAAYPASTNFFGVAVQPKEDSSAIVPRALVRASVVLGDDSGGRTTFVRDSVTDDDRGVATFSLLPGTLSTLITYSFQISPPAQSKYGTLCTTIPVGVGSTGGTAAVLPTVQLLRRPVVSGVVLNAYNVKVPNVIVTATLTGPPPPDPDPNAPAWCPPIIGPVNTVTDAKGAFRLGLDPGTYQLDFDPPAGGPWPRLTEESFPVTGDLLHDVVLSAGEVIYGSVNDSNNLPLANAVVRLYEPRCMTSEDCTGPNTAPLLQAQVQTGPDGSFMAVVPAALKR